MQCKARTLLGNRCTREVNNASYCYQHKNYKKKQIQYILGRIILYLSIISSLIGIVSFIHQVFGPNIYGNFFSASRFFHLGEAEFDKGKYNNAEKYFLKALEKDPALQSINYFLGYIRFIQNNDAKAKELLDKVKFTEKNFINAQRTIALIHFRKQKYVELRSTAEKILNKDPNNIFGRFMITISKKDETSKAIITECKKNIEILSKQKSGLVEFDAITGKFSRKFFGNEKTANVGYLSFPDTLYNQMLLFYSYVHLSLLELYELPYNNAIPYNKSFFDIINNEIKLDQFNIKKYTDTCLIMHDSTSNIEYIGIKIMNETRFYEKDQLRNIFKNLKKSMSIPVPLVQEYKNQSNKKVNKANKSDKELLKTDSFVKTESLKIDKKTYYSSHKEVVDPKIKKHLEKLFMEFKKKNPNEYMPSNKFRIFTTNIDGIWEVIDNNRRLLIKTVAEDPKFQIQVEGFVFQKNQQTYECIMKPLETVDFMCYEIEFMDIKFEKSSVKRIIRIYNDLKFIYL